MVLYSFALVVILFAVIWTRMKHRNRTVPVSVNYHFSRKCNKTCGFCFHTERESHVETKENIFKGLTLLKQAGMRKLNFAGGEPFLYPDLLGKMCQFAKVGLGLESVSIISNGTKVTKQWLDKWGQYVDVLGISCDSFDESINFKIGRGSGENKTQLFRIRDWCRELGIKFKLNTVVCSHNWMEDMRATIAELAPFRWKVFQVLLVEGENENLPVEAKGRIAHARDFLISDEQFEAFCVRHKHLECFVPESNLLMASTYLIVDEYMRFLDKGNGYEKTSPSILDIGVHKALEYVRWDEEGFKQRGGLYDWSKTEGEDKGCGGDTDPKMEW